MQTSQDVLNCLLQLNHTPSTKLRNAAHAWASEPEGGSLGMPAASLASLTASGNASQFTAQMLACSKLAQVMYCHSSPQSGHWSPHSNHIPASLLCWCPVHQYAANSALFQAHSC